MSLFRSLRSSLRGEGYALVQDSPSSSIDDPECEDLEEKTTSVHVLPLIEGRLRRLSLYSIVATTISISTSILVYLLPSFVTGPLKRYLSERSKHAPQPQRVQSIRPTAYLDGLRGVAALVVYIFHYTYLWYPVLRNGYGCSEDNVLFWQLPIVRALHSGRASVTVFFVISGYVLTTKTLTIIYRGQHERILDTLAGSLFRRPFRLYLPIVVATGIIATLVRYHLYRPNPTGGGIPPIANNAHDQFWHWWATVKDVTNPFRVVTSRDHIYANPYDGHLWTIPTEFKGSLLVFLYLLAFAKAKRWVHLLAVVVGGYWQVKNGDSDQALFCGGLFLAELALIIPPESYRLPQGMSRILSVSPRGVWLFRHVVTISLFLLGLHLFSYPEKQGPETPGFRMLSDHVPEYYTRSVDYIQQFWISIGAIIFVVALMYSPPLRSIPNSAPALPASQLPVSTPASGLDMPAAAPEEPFLQRLFTNRFAQYLGDVSYSLYLCHDSVNHIVGMRYLRPAWHEWAATDQRANALEEDGLMGEAAEIRARMQGQYARAWVMGMLANTIVLFWASDLFTRAVDANAVKLTRKLWGWSIAKKA
ncbi:Acyltransferase [Pleurostoma richardsiae]|uniref:Acyltransferase n=1 Tax=Pleurostoma richardsiae TaxID=41990 RepID=A0AA38VMX3_9PEZI|nr:Acyltransferase [Pleurostoma richardsiae]